MTEKVYGLTSAGMRTLSEIKRRVLPALPRVPRVKRRVWDEATEGTGGGSERIHFTIDSYDYTTGIAVVNVEYRPCGVATVSGEVEGQVEVIDPAGCYFDEDEEDLIGRWGHADYMAPIASIDPYQTCQWIVSGLCCLS